MKMVCLRQAAQVFVVTGLVVGVCATSSTTASAMENSRVGSSRHIASTLSPQLVLRGSAQELPGNIVQLTDDLGQAGAAWSAQPVSVLGGLSATFRFRILPDPDCCADGFAFVIQNDKRGTKALAGGGGEEGFAQDTPVGIHPPPAQRGIKNGVAVEFDTFYNACWSSPCRPGSVSDPFDEHISVLARTLNRRLSADEKFSLGLTTSIPDLTTGAEHAVEIIYRPGTLTIALDQSSVLTVPLNLPKKMILPNGTAYVGFTGSTGGYAQTPQIRDFSVTSS